MKPDVGICLGRFSPLHIAHAENIATTQKCFEKSLVIIGSAESKPTLRNPFNYVERRGFIKKLFPNVNVVGIPDFWDKHGSWYQALDDIIEAVFGECRPFFIGGSIEDLKWFKKYDVMNVNRHDRDVEISGTILRDILFREKNPYSKLRRYIPGAILRDVCSLFESRYKELL